MIEDPALLASQTLAINSGPLAAIRRGSVLRRRSIPDICAAVAELDRQIEGIHAPQATMSCAEEIAYLERYELVTAGLGNDQSRLLGALAAQPISTRPVAVAAARLA